MAKGKQDRKPELHRVVKFPLNPSPEQEKLLLRISDGLREVYNWSLRWRLNALEIYRYKKDLGEKPPFIDCLKEVGCEELGPDYQVPEHIKQAFYIQVWGLPILRKRDRERGFFRGTIPSNWKEETLDALDASFKSFFALHKNKDPDAGTSGFRSEWRACEIPGRSSFSLKKKGFITFAPNIFGKETLRFAIPKNVYIPPIVQARGGEEAKFTVFRDEENLARPGRWYVSVDYVTEQPELLPFRPERNVVWVAPGLSYYGVIAPDGTEESIPLLRPDEDWKPLTDEVEERLKIRKDVKPEERLQKGSKVWRKRIGARREMFRLMAAQQRKDQRRIASRLAKLYPNCHFVLTELVVRSKEGKLADASRPEQGGAPHGQNWASSRGYIGYFAQHLEEKGKERGIVVRKHKLPLPPEECLFHPPDFSLVRRLKSDFLASYRVKAAEA